MRTKILLIITIIIVTLSSCVTTKISVQYATTIAKTSELTIGMSKKKVPEVLGIYPFDIYQNYENSCEIHHYLYKDMQREHLLATTGTTEGLANGSPKYLSLKNLYLIFREGKLASIITDSGINDAYNLLYFSGLSNDICNNNNKTYITPEYEYIEEDADCEYCKIVNDIINKGNGNININIPTPSTVFDKKYKKVIKK